MLFIFSNQDIFSGNSMLTSTYEVLATENTLKKLDKSRAEVDFVRFYPVEY